MGFHLFADRLSRMVVLAGHIVVIGPSFSFQELCTGGDLYARLPYIEHQVAVVMKQVLNAVNYMHDRKVMHRDMYVELRCTRKRSATSFQFPRGLHTLTLYRSFFVGFWQQNGEHLVRVATSTGGDQVN